MCDSTVHLFALYDIFHVDSVGMGCFDIFCYEEPGRPDEPLLRYKNVILTPHTAPGTRQSGMKDVEEMCAKMWRRLTAQPT